MGEIITFYSYKGGTGRTMALANTAVLMAKHTPGKVLMIDWDLEAPGLHRYFSGYLRYEEDEEGLIEFVEEACNRLEEMPYGKENHDELEQYFKEINRYLVSIDLPNAASNLFLLKAGEFDDDYSERINDFDWGAFFKKIPAFFPLFADFLTKHFDYVFIDSRTGHTDVGGICTMLMPEKLVLVFTPNHQSLDGVYELARKATEYRLSSDDDRPLIIYPLPSRVDLEATDLAIEWRIKYENEWKQVFQEIYSLPPTISLKKYFDIVRIRHDAVFSYGEDLAVFSAVSTEIGNNFQSFVNQLSLERIWDNEPFANIESPFEVFCIFAKEDREYVDRFISHLSMLNRQNVVTWSRSQMKAVEEWDSTIHRKVASLAAELLVVFVSTNLLTNQVDNSWENYVNEAVRSQFKDQTKRVFPILINNIETNGLFKDLPIFPSRTKPLLSWEDPDDAWLRITEAFRREVVKINEHNLKRIGNGNT